MAIHESVLPGQGLLCRFFCMALLLLPGCVIDRQAGIDPGKAIILSPDTGIVVGSVTAPMVQHYWEIGHFRYRRLGESTGGVLESASATANYHWGKNRPIEPWGVGPDAGLEQELGRLFAVELPAGTYEIYQLDARGRALIDMPPVRFEVTAGAVRYLGNLHVAYCLYAPDLPSYRGYINAGLPSVRDQSQRDLRLLLQKFPSLKDKPIGTAVIDDSAWKNLQQTGLPSPETECGIINKG